MLLPQLQLMLSALNKPVQELIEHIACSIYMNSRWSNALQRALCGMQMVQRGQDSILRLDQDGVQRHRVLIKTTLNLGALHLFLVNTANFDASLSRHGSFAMLHIFLGYRWGNGVRENKARI